jgi:hypothetical protein
MGFADILLLLEHLPKVGALLAKLMPMLENYIPNARLNAPATLEGAPSAIDDLRAELGRSAAAQAALALEVHARGEQLTVALAELRSVRAAQEASTAQVDAMQKQLKVQRIFLGLAALASVLTLVLLIVRK